MEADCTAGDVGSAFQGNLNGTRIVGGSAATPYKYPWLVGLVNSDKDTDIYCGGTLLSSRTVLTAAHCGCGKWVLIGGHDLIETSGNERWMEVEATNTHPKYSSATFSNDFAIMTLKDEVVFNQYARPICLPTDDSGYESDRVWVAGWGTLTQGGSRPSVLQEVQVTTMLNAQCCASPYKYNCHWILDSMICAADAGKDSCQGDSGGPLMFEQNGLYTLIGVVSWGQGCADASYPGVYARVSSVLGWIKERIEGKKCPCQL